MNKPGLLTRLRDPRGHLGAGYESLDLLMELLESTALAADRIDKLEKQVRDMAYVLGQMSNYLEMAASGHYVDWNTVNDDEGFDARFLLKEVNRKDT